MTAPQHLTITGPEDILGYVPHSLGYWPSRSLVAMTMQGKRLGATLRVDLPEGASSRHGLEDFSRTVAQYLLADDDANGTLLMFFTDDGWTDASGPPGGRELLADLETALGLAGMPVRDAWYVGAEYWRNVYCTDTGCCPLPGRPLAEIRDSRLNAEMVYLGSSVGAPPGDGPAGGPEPEENPAVLAAEQRWTETLCGKRASRPQFERVLDTWESALAAKSGTTRLPHEVAGFLRATLCVPSWRDAVLVMAAAGRPAAVAGAEEFGIFSALPGPPATVPSGMEVPAVTARPSVQPAGAAEPGSSPVPGNGEVPDNQEVPGYGEVLLGLTPLVPDWTRMKSLEDAMLQLAHCGPGEAQAAAWTAKAWIEWCRGRGSYAHASLGRALEAAPGYRLAELLSEVVRRGTICGWAARREAAWQKFGTDAA
ncbi:DUF4192 domain-containing protein [Arthrobacter pascens]|uniref:DUF4192 domain-containing protein n=1 Tax=Arthrobacter pascens TaxID=1677 RepID=UPI00196A8580|nr:DUF4192 domain-containing protein [Arthrobacter pascens]MBN3497981.1 DUF4192 domain-containing protein [Arthrobacter pascens]